MLRLRLSAKLIGGFMVMGLLLLIGGSVGSLGISQVSDDLRSFSEYHLPGIRYLATIGKSQQMISTIDHSLAGLDSSGTDNHGGTRLITQIEEACARAEEARKRYDTLPKEGDMASRWNSLTGVWETWR